MCARYVIRSSADEIRSLFELDELVEFEPRYNVAPTQDVLAIINQDGHREATMFRWGLIPSWAKDATLGQKMINARSETVREKPSFRAAFAKRRCLIVANGFYEWTDPEEEVGLGGLFQEPDQDAPKKRPPRQPHWIGMKDRGPFAFAGLWELNQQTELGSVETCCILTTTPNELLEPMHDRMPVILPQELWDPWLDPNFANKDTLQAMLVPFRSELMDTYKVSPKVNSPRAYGSELMNPIAS